MISNYTRGIILMVSMMSIEYLLYGGYTLLFAIAIAVLHRRKARKQASNRLHLISLIVLFLLTTLVVLLHSAQSMRIIVLNCLDIPLQDIHDKVVINLGVSLGLLPLLANFITDLILIYRLFIIWAFKKRMAFAFLAVSCINHMFGICAVVAFFFYGATNVAAVEEIVFFGANLIINILLTSCIAGKIWRITQQVKTFTKPSVQRSYSNVVVIILESGVIYAFLHIVVIILTLTIDAISIQIIPVCVPVVAAVPTVIIVRAGLGVTIENPDAAKTSFHVSSVIAPGVGYTDYDLESNNSDITQLQDLETTDSATVVNIQ